MKVVLFCGGMGMRIREYSERVPKPMIPIGSRPILWHLMKYYAHFGHRDFILCLGYQASVIKEYFLSYDECISNDFILRQGGRELQLVNSDIQDWTITFVDTGMNTPIGGRLKAVQPYLAGEEVFLANYSDNLTDLPLPQMLEEFRARGKTAAFLCVPPGGSYHLVRLGPENLVERIVPIGQANLQINGGYFIFRRKIFDYIHDGEELVEQPFWRLHQDRQLLGYPYAGFFKSMDTFKERQVLEELYASGRAPWEVWRQPANGDLPCRDAASPGSPGVPGRLFFQNAVRRRKAGNDSPVAGRGKTDSVSGSPLR